MARTTRYASATGTDTYANSTNSATPMSLATALANAVAGDDIYFKGSLSATTTNHQPTNAGTTAQPIRLIGYSSTTTDGYQGRTNGNGALITTNMPTITYTTGSFQMNAKAGWIIENFNITGASTGGETLQVGSNSRAINCNVTNTGVNANAGAILIGGTESGIINCDATASGSTSNAALRITSGTSSVHGGRFTCPNGYGILASNAVFFASFPTIYTCVVGIYFNVTSSTRKSTVVNPTIYNCSTAGVQYSNWSGHGAHEIINGMITDCGMAFKSLYSGTGNLTVIRYGNRTRDNTSADTGFDDVPIYQAITTDTGGASTDYTATGSNDFSLVSSSPGKAAAIPSYLSCGALQPQGGVILIED